VKKIDAVLFAGKVFTDFPFDFGYFSPELEINGLVGLDILLSGCFYIDLQHLMITAESQRRIHPLANSSCDWRGFLCWADRQLSVLLES
jgi:hypothetical protein